MITARLERGALVGAGEVDLAGEIDRVGAGSGPRQRGADLGGRGAAGVGLLGETRVAGDAAAAMRRFGTVGNSGQGARKARRGGDGEGGEVLVAVVAGDFEGEGGVGAAVLPAEAALKPGLKGRWDPPDMAYRRARSRG